MDGVVNGYGERLCPAVRRKRLRFSRPETGHHETLYTISSEYIKGHQAFLSQRNARVENRLQAVL